MEIKSNKLRGFAWACMVFLLIPMFHELDGAWRYLGLIGYVITGWIFGKYFSLLEEMEK